VPSGSLSSSYELGSRPLFHYNEILTQIADDALAPVFWTDRNGALIAIRIGPEPAPALRRWQAQTRRREMTRRAGSGHDTDGLQAAAVRFSLAIMSSIMRRARIAPASILRLRKGWSGSLSMARCCASTTT
jgi:hypothetical protein